MTAAVGVEVPDPGGGVGEWGVFDANRFDKDALERRYGNAREVKGDLAVAGGAFVKSGESVMTWFVDEVIT